MLLVGDAQSMPLRDMMLDRATKAACDVAFYPSDLYYADLTDDAGADGERKFADWNHRTDGVHGRYIGEVHGEGRGEGRGEVHGEVRGEVRGEVHGESGKDGPIDADDCGMVAEIAVG